MNSVQRRLFRAFAEAGGDLSEDAQVEQFIRYVEGNLVLLPPKVREAVELVWRCSDGAAYGLLAAQLGKGAQSEVTAASLRQRVSRGTRLLEYAVRRRAWAPPEGDASTVPRAQSARAPAAGSGRQGGARPRGSAA